MSLLNDITVVKMYIKLMSDELPVAVMHLDQPAQDIGKEE